MWGSREIEHSSPPGETKVGLFSSMFSSSANKTTAKLDSAVSSVLGEERGKNFDCGASVRSDESSNIAEVFTKRQQLWDEQAANQDLKQAELFHQQWTLVREQMSTFSHEVIQMRAEIRSLASWSTQCKQDLADETQRRQELASRLEMAVKAIGEEADSSTRGLQAEILDRREAQDRASREIAGMEERMNRGVQELRRHMESALENLEVERRERVSSDERIRSTVSELQLGLDEEKGQRAQSFDNIEKEVLRLRQAMEEEVRKRATTVGEVTAEVRKLADGADAEARERAATDNSLRQAIRDVNILLEQETKSRTSSVLQLEKNLETTLVSLRTSFGEEASKRRGEMGTVNESLQKVRADLERESIERSKSNDYLMQLMSQTRQGLEKEDEQLAKQLSQVRQALEKEAQERLKEQDGHARSAREALVAVETERQERVSADEAMRKTIAQMEVQKGTALAEFQEELQRLQFLTESENKARSAGSEEANRSCQELRSLLEEQSRALKDAEERISGANREYLKTISDALELETKQRLAGDEEAIRAATHAKQLCEKETRDRNTAEDQVTQRMREVTGSIDKERSDRELSEASTRMQLQTCQQGLLTEKKERVDEDAALRRSLNILDGQIAQQGKEITNSLESEGQERRLVQDRFENRHNELRSAIETDAKLLKDLVDRLKLIADAVETERREREAGMEGMERLHASEKRDRIDEDATLRRGVSSLEIQITQGLKDLKINIDGEATERKAAHDFVDKRLNELRGGFDADKATSAAHLQERLRSLAESHESLVRERYSGDETYVRRIQDLATSIDQMRVDREIADSSMKSQIASCRQEVASEREERSSEIAAVRRAHSALEVHHSQMIKDMRLTIETEATERSSLAERLEKRCSEFREQADREATARIETTDEVQRGMRAVRQSVEHEVRERTEECLNISNLVQRLQDRFDTDTSERVRVISELQDRVKSAMDVVDKEATDRNEGKDEMTRRMQELSSTIDQERAERELGDSQVKAHVAGFKQELSLERDERAEQVGAIRRNLQALEAQESQHHHDLQLAIEAEATQRGVLEDRHEKRCRDLGNTLDSDGKSRAAELSALDEGLRTLRQAHEQHSRTRTDEHLQATTEIQRALDKLQHEESERVNLRKLVEDLWDKMQTLTEATSLEKNERTTVDDELVQRITAVVAALEEQKNTLENSDASVKAQLTSSKQEAAIEREQRIAEDAGLRRMVQDFEGQIGKQVEDLKLALDGATGKHDSQLEQGITLLSQKVDRESRSRADELAKAMSEVQQLEAKVTGECQARASDATAVDERFKSLTDALNAEAQERAAGDQESARLALQSSHAVEKETKDRQLVQESLTTRIQDLVTALESHQKDLKAEREDRTQEGALLHHALQSHENSTSALVANIRDNMVSESTERKNEFDRLHGLHMETRGFLDEKIAKGAEEHSRSLSDLRDKHQSLHDVVQEKHGELHGKLLEKHGELNEKFNEKHGELSQHVSDSMQGAINELRQQQAKELAERRSADDELSMRIEQEKTRRSEFVSELLAAIETEATERRSVDETHAQRVNKLEEELKASLAKEAELWSATLETHEAKHDEAHQRSKTKVQELEQSLRETLESEVAQLREAATGLAKALELEATERAAGDDAEAEARKTALAQQDEKQTEARKTEDLRLEDLLRALDARLQKLIEVAASREAFDALEERVNEAANALHLEITEAEERLNEADAALLGPIREELTLAVGEMSKETEELTKQINDLTESSVQKDVYAEEKAEREKELKEKLEEYEKGKSEIAEQVKDITFAWKQEAQRLWEGLDGHTHDVKVEDDVLSNGQFSSAATPKQVVRETVHIPVGGPTNMHTVSYLPPTQGSMRAVMGPVIKATATSRGNSPVSTTASVLSGSQVPQVVGQEGGTPLTARRGFAWQTQAGPGASPPSTQVALGANGRRSSMSQHGLEGLSSAEASQAGSMNLPYGRSGSPTPVSAHSAHSVPTWGAVGVKVANAPSSPRTAKTPPHGHGHPANGFSPANGQHTTIMTGNARRSNGLNTLSPASRQKASTHTECSSAKYNPHLTNKASLSVLPA